MGMKCVLKKMGEEWGMGEGMGEEWEKWERNERNGGGEGVKYQKKYHQFCE
jgi:hypothetical protein